MAPDNDSRKSSCTIPVVVEEEDPLLCGVKMSEITAIAHIRSHARRQSRRASNFFNIPSQDELNDIHSHARRQSRRASNFLNIPSQDQLNDNQSQARRQSRRVSNFLGIPSQEELEDSRRQSRRASTFFNIPSLEELQDVSFRGKCSRLIHSFKFQGVVIGFVILDCIFVISELIVDLRITRGEVCDRVTCAPIKKDHTLGLILQSLSLAVLSLFIIELTFKLWVLRLKFFQSKMEIFDAIIVVISWSLDIAFFHHSDDPDAVSILIFLRMWRLIRIVHAIAVSMITPVIHQLEHEEHAHHITEVKFEKITDYAKELEAEIKELRHLLHMENNRSLPITRVKETTVDKIIMPGARIPNMLNKKKKLELH